MIAGVGMVVGDYEALFGTNTLTTVTCHSLNAEVWEISVADFNALSQVSEESFVDMKKRSRKHQELMNQTYLRKLQETQLLGNEKFGSSDQDLKFICGNIMKEMLWNRKEQGEPTKGAIDLYSMKKHF